MPDAIARKADGTGAMFSVGETPWHKEGTVLERPPRSIEEALKIAGLDFEVGLKQVYFHDGYSMNEIPGCQASYRQDNGEVLGVVRSQYRPLQNRDAFRVLQPLLDSGKAVLETAGALRLGEDVWILVRFDLDDPVVQEVFADEVKPFGLLSRMRRMPPESRQPR